MSDILREHVAPGTARGCGCPYSSACDGCDIALPVLHKNVHMAVPFMHLLATPPTRKGCFVYRVSSMLAARKWAWRLVVIHAGVDASSRPQHPFYFGKT